MKLLFAIITLLAVLAFLYFWVAGLLTWLRALGERKPGPKARWFGTFLGDDSYTDRGKELVAKYHRAWFFGMVSGLVMLLAGSRYVHLRDGATGPWPPKDPAFVALPAILFMLAFLAFLGSVAWLLFGLSRAGFRRWRNEATSEPQRRDIWKSLRWVAGSFVVATLAQVMMRNL